ncbi:MULTISPECIES: hypothetical protein [Bacteroidales]|jgi:hypothetical protein|nr:MULTISPECIES: hypothetical protein [Bacteroidales]ROT10305.1 hypothetical protein EEL49_03960 [Muribaculaceae bacterium Isolate-104 (HZI)]RXE72727.1 hypothetical protein ED551_12295 [Muribaculaceae bacterium Isolate-013 (NCI)]HBY17339.1 hypothetical protein [Porphyromonadaceae bacterium]
MEERKITEAESIEIITSMISRTKDRLVKGSGNILLMWGYLIVAVTALIWVLLVTTNNPAVNWLWFLIWIIGGIATPIMAKKERVASGSKSYTDKLTSQMWSVVGLTGIASALLCLGFLVIGGKDSWSMMFAFALIIVPMAEIMQGLVIKEISLIAGGSIGLLTGIFTTCCISAHVALMASWFMPLFIIAFAAMMIVPGHILNSKAKRGL